MKRSVNFRRGKRLTPRGLLDTMKFVGMSDEEIRGTLEAVRKCSCGPNDLCNICAKLQHDREKA